MAETSVIFKPMLRTIKPASLGLEVRSITYLSGNLYGVEYGSGETTLAKVPLFGTTSNQTLSIAMTSVQDITNDNSNLFAVEERTGSAGASTNQIMKITTTGTCTALTTNHLNMRSVVYDSINKCLYISCPFDTKIRKATGGGIGGDNSSFAINDFVTGITNKPGRLWLNESATTLYYTVEDTEKRIGAINLSAGAPGVPTYYSFGGPTGETHNLTYLEDFDTFIYSGDSAAALGVSLGTFNQLFTGLSIDVRMSQGVVLPGSMVAYPDDTAIKYADISSEERIFGGYNPFTADEDSGFCVITGWAVAENAGGAARVLLRDGSVSGPILADIQLAAGQSVGENYNNPLAMKKGNLFVDVTSGSVRGSIYGR